MKRLFLLLSVTSIINASFAQSDQKKVSPYSRTGFLVQAETEVGKRPAFAIKSTTGEVINFLAESEDLADLYNQFLEKELPLTINFQGYKKVDHKNHVSDSLDSITLFPKMQQFSGTLIHEQNYFKIEISAESSPYVTKKVVIFSPSVVENASHLLRKLGPKPLVYIRGAEVFGGLVIMANSLIFK